MKLGELPIGTIVQWKGTAAYIIIPKATLLLEAPELKGRDRVAVISLADLKVEWAPFYDDTYTIIEN